MTHEEMEQHIKDLINTHFESNKRNNKRIENLTHQIKVLRIFARQHNPHTFKTIETSYCKIFNLIPPQD